MFRKIKLKAYQLFLFLMLFFVADFAFARAGGGHGESGRGITINYVGRSRYRSYRNKTFEDYLWEFFLIILIIACIIGYKYLKEVSSTQKLKKLALEQGDAAHDMIQRSETEDPAWNETHFMARVEEVFFKVHQAWTERNQEPARDCMSPKLYQNHKSRTDAMILVQRRNVLKHIKLDEVRIIGMEDWLDNSRDSFSAFLSGSMVDFHLHEERNEITRGDKTPIQFMEIWRFIRQENTWVVDEIDKHITQDDVFYSPMRKQQLPDSYA